MSTGSITTALGVGSGIDFAALTSSLVEAQFSAKTAALNRQNTTLSAQISSVSDLKSGISSFSSGLTQLVKDGSLSTQPTSSNTNLVTVSGAEGAKLAGFSASVEVSQLAAAQSAATGPIADRTASIGTGSFTLTFGTASISGGAFTSFTAGSAAPVTIAIDAANSSLDGIAKAINAANAGVTATVITDVSGARLTLKGPSGEAKAFTLTATEDAAAPGLSALNVGPGATGTTVGSTAQDAIIVVDGVSLKRPTNSFGDLIPGVQVNLVGAAVGTVVTLGTKSPVANLSKAVRDFVDTFNQLQAVVKQATNASTGALFADPAAKTLSRALGQLTLTALTTGGAAGAPTTLADIGVSTNRDGTLSVNADRLAAQLAKYPDAIETMLAAGTGASGNGLSAALAAISDKAIDKVSGLGASETRYAKLKTQISTDRDSITTQSEQLRARLTRQFAGTEARVAAYRSTQEYLKQQVAAWNSNR